MLAIWEKRKAGKRKESRSALPKAKKIEADWVLYHFRSQYEQTALCGASPVCSRRRTRLGPCLGLATFTPT